MQHENLNRESEVKSSSNRVFGFVFGIFFLLIGLLPLLARHPPRIWSLAVAALFGLIAAVIPALLAPLNRLWTRLGLLLNKIVSPIVLGLAFYLMIAPLGMIMRLFGKDLLRLRFDRTQATYWIPRTPPGPPGESLGEQP
jgi:predicted membrane metal-binding protein